MKIKAGFSFYPVQVIEHNEVLVGISSPQPYGKHWIFEVKVGLEDEEMWV